MKIHLYFFILLSLFTVNLNATTIVYKTLNQLIDESDLDSSVTLHDKITIAP